MSSKSYARSRARVGAVVFVAMALGLAACGNSTPEASSGGSQISSKTDGTASGGGDGDLTTNVPNDSPGVTDTEITYASFGTNSNNPLGTCVLDCFDAGVKAYFDWRNSEGGIYGRKLVLDPELDDQLAQNQQKALEIISANEAFGAFSAAQLANGYADMAQAGIPLYTWAINFNEMNGNQGIYGNAPVTCAGCDSRSVPYAGTVVGAKKVGSLGYGISQNSKDCANSVANSVKKYGDKTGQTAAYLNDNLSFGLPNGIAPEVTAMKDAGVDFVSTCLDLNGVKTLETEMARQGMGDVPVLHANTYDADYIKSAGDLFEGDIVGVSFRPFEADAGDSQLKQYNEWTQKGGYKVSELGVEGWINADIAYQGLKAAGPNFTRESVIAATNKLTAFTAGGLTPPIDWSRQHDLPTNEDPVTHGPKDDCRAFVRVKNQKFELVGPKDKPFICWKTSDRSWSEPTNMNFE